MRDEAAGRSTEFLEPGAPVSPGEVEAFLRDFSRQLPAADVVVLSGSMPQGLPVDFYAVLVRLARQAGKPVLLEDVYKRQVLEPLGSFLSADRAYLFMKRQGLFYNDYEWCRAGITPQKEVLQAVSPSIVSRWLPIFAQQECVIQEDVEKLSGSDPEEYELLHAQGIQSLVAAPLNQDGQLLGLLGVDNPPPERIRSIASLLQTLCYFLMLAYRRTESEQQLSLLSYHDTLTSFYNRNRYIEDTAALAGTSGPVGVVYLDVNGLKDINDQRGHAVGDTVLVECTRQIQEVFRNANYYRIGGDEFVILCPGIDRDTFDQRVAALRRHFQADTVCKAAIGAQWESNGQDIQQITARADAKMYEMCIRDR